MNYLRIISAFMLLSAGLSGCMEETPSNINPKLVEISDKGCVNDTKASSEKAYLYLDNEDGNLVVKLCGVGENCAFKYTGFTADVFADGNTISLYINHNYTISANCVCTVEEIKTTISGLENGSYDIVIYFNDWGSWKESFRFSKSLHKKTSISKWL